MSTFRVPVDITWTGSGSPGVNVWHFRSVLDDPDDTIIQGAVTRLRAFYAALAALDYGPALGIWPAHCTLKCPEVLNVETAEAHAVTWASLTGGNDGTMAPPGCQICVSWRTNTSARRGMGRNFLGPLTGKSIQTDGTLLDAMLTGVRSAATAFVAADVAATDTHFGVFGLVTAGGTADSPHMVRDFVSASVADRFANLSSRRD